MSHGTTVLIRTTKLMLIATAALALAAGAARASAGDVIRDCSDDGVLNKKYSQKELSGALSNLPSDLDEYTDCRTVIRQAQLAGARGKRGERHAGVLGLVDRAKPPGPDELRKLDRATKSAGAIDIGGQRIHAGGTGTAFENTGLGTHLPPILLAALIGLAAAMLSGGALTFRRRWPAAWRGAGGAISGPIRRLGDGVRRGTSRFRR